MKVVIPAFTWPPIAPLGLLAFAAILVLLASLFTERDEESTLWMVPLFGLLAAGYSMYNLWGHTTSSAFSGMIVIDHFALAIGFIILFAAACALILAWQDRAFGAEYMVLILLATLGMLLFTEANNLITVFLGIEILSLPLYVLSGIHGHRAASREAAVKYVLMGALSSGILLYGMALVYAGTGVLGLEAIGTHMSHGAGSLAYVGVALIVVGLGFKLALVPFHNWMPDVYQGAPIAITAFMSVATKAAAFAAFARVLLVAFPFVYHQWLPVLWGLAGLTMLLGNLMALRQRSMKRLLAYSGITHAGFLVVTLVAATGLGLFASIFYLLAYAFMNLGAFAVVQGLSRDDEEGDRIESFRGLFFRHPLAAGAMLVFLLSLASIPTTAGFMAKLSIILAAVQAGVWPLAVVLVVATMIGLYVYLKVAVAMFDRSAVGAEGTGEGAATRGALALGEVGMGAGGPPPEMAVAAVRAAPVLTLGAWIVVAVSVCGTFVFGLWPGPLLHLLNGGLLLP